MYSYVSSDCTLKQKKMSWFDTAGFASFAKSALTTAQKTIDKALDIKDENIVSPELITVPVLDGDSFFEAFGLNEKLIKEISSGKQNVLTEKNNKVEIKSAQNSGFWTDTWGSFFETKTSTSEAPGTSSNPQCDSEASESVKISNIKMDDTVLSQPQRAGLFPSEVKSSVADDSADATSSKYIESKQNLNFSNSLKEDKPNLECHDPSISYKNVVEEVGVSHSSVAHDVKNSPEQECDNNAVQVDFAVKSELLLNKSDIYSGTINEIVAESFPKATSVTEHAVPDKSVLLADAIINPPVHRIKISDFNESTTSHESIVNNKSHKSEAQNYDSDSSSPKTNTVSEYDIIDIGETVVHEPLTSVVNASACQSNVPSTETSEIPLDCSSSENRSCHSDVLGVSSTSISESYINWEWAATDKSCIDSCNSEKVKSDNEPMKEINADSSTPPQTHLSSYIDSFQVLSIEPRKDWVGETEKSSQFEHAFEGTSADEHLCRRDSESSKGEEEEDTETTEVNECEVKSSDSGGSHATTSSSSFVKCSAEDNNSHRATSPFSATNSERSDVTKLESEQNTSGDENETATSSDIEILSPPHGDNGDRHIPTLKHMWMTRPMNRRSESPASDIATPVKRDDIVEKSSYIRSYDLYCPKDEKDISYRQRLNIPDHFEKVFQREEDLQNILETREKQILELSKENVKLRESEEKLQNEIKQITAAHVKESQDMSAFTKEFSERLALTESKMQSICQERDALKKKLEDAQTEVVRRVTIAEMEDILKEKDQQIKELIEEGEKLSKKELQHTTIIKKLRAKEEETTNILKSQKEKLEENMKEVERLRKSLGAKDEQEKKHIDAIRHLTSTVQKQEKEIASLQSSLEDAVEKQLSLKNSLDSTYKDLTELKKSTTAKETEIQELTLSVEMVANEKVRETLDQVNKQAVREKETLLLQIEDLRNSLKRHDEEANIREKALKADIANLQMRLQDAEARNEELTKNISSATRPLVRQIENLQATYNTQIASWEKVEKNLTDRLSDAQKQLTLCSEKERQASEKYLELTSKITKLEAQNSALRQEKLQLSSELEILKSKFSVLEESQNKESTTVTVLKQNLSGEINKLKKEKEALEKDVLKYIDQIEIEKKKVEFLQEELSNRDLKQLSTGSHSPPASLRSSVDSINNWSQDETQERRASTPVNNYRMSVYDSLRIGSASSMLENLQSQLKQREGEIFQLQSEISRLEREKESIAQEFVELSNQNEELEQKLEKLEELEESYKDLDQKYNTLLQMYGEKVEEAEELQLDLADVKSMYKAQIEELLKTK